MRCAPVTTFPSGTVEGEAQPFAKAGASEVRSLNELEAGLVDGGDCGVDIERTVAGVVTLPASRATATAARSNHRRS